MAEIINGGKNLGKGILKVTRGGFDTLSGVGDVVGNISGLASSGVQQIQKFLFGGAESRKRSPRSQRKLSPKRRCDAMTSKRKPCKRYARKGKLKCCIHL
jgi:hypothetical protein